MSFHPSHVITNLYHKLYDMQFAKNKTLVKLKTIVPNHWYQQCENNEKKIKWYIMTMHIFMFNYSHGYLFSNLLLNIVLSLFHWTHVQNKINELQLMCMNNMSQIFQLIKKLVMVLWKTSNKSLQHCWILPCKFIPKANGNCKINFGV